MKLIGSLLIELKKWKEVVLTVFTRLFQSLPFFVRWSCWIRTKVLNFTHFVLASKVNPTFLSQLKFQGVGWHSISVKILPQKPKVPTRNKEKKKSYQGDLMRNKSKAFIFSLLDFVLILLKYYKILKFGKEIWNNLNMDFPVTQW